MNPLRQSTGPKSPVVITSKAASKDLQNIQIKHDDMVMGMREQAMKVQQYNQERAATMANENAMRGEMEKEKMTANTETQKNAMDFNIRQGELDVKRAGLNQ